MLALERQLLGDVLEDVDDAAAASKLAADGDINVACGPVGEAGRAIDGDTMDTVAAAINAKNGALSASVANGVLRLTAKQTGAASAIEITADPGVSLGSFSDLVNGQNATGTLGTKAIDSPTNTVSNALTGVTLSLLATTPAVSIV